jgi:hypothetical protein
VKLGTSAVLLWLSIGVTLGAAVGGFWFIEGTISLDQSLWVHHVRNYLGLGGPIYPSGPFGRARKPLGLQRDVDGKKSRSFLIGGKHCCISFEWAKMSTGGAAASMAVTRPA